MNFWFANALFVAAATVPLLLFYVLKQRIPWLQRHDWIEIVVRLTATFLAYLWFYKHGFRYNPRMFDY